MDAGGGTIDVSTYKGQGDSFQETAIPQCELLLHSEAADSRYHRPLSRVRLCNGTCSGVYKRCVSARAINLKLLCAQACTLDLFRGSEYEDYVPYIVEHFDTAAKLTFRDETLPQYIRFAHPKHTDSSLGIRNGQLKLLGYV